MKLEKSKSIGTQERGKGNIRLFVEDEDITTTFENSVSSREPSETATDNNDLCHFIQVMWERKKGDGMLEGEV